MEQTSIEKKLDLLLEYLKNNQSSAMSIKIPTAQVIEFYDYDIKNKIDFSGRELCIQKLLKDKYIEGSLSNDAYSVRITIDGLLFCNEGGYTERKRKSRISTNHKQIQNWAIAIGAIVAGVYALFQMLQGFLNFFCSCK
jgi:hypothetical protein